MGDIKLKQGKKGSGMKLGPNKLYEAFPKMIPKNPTIERKGRK